MGNFSQENFNKFIIDNGVYGFFDEPITLKSGRRSHFYVNFRNVVEDVWMTNKLAEYVLDFVDDNKVNVDTFYGVPEGATKLGIILQYKWAMKNNSFEGSHSLSMGRAKPKEHGEIKDRFFVGMPKGNVLVVEDVTTTGMSLISTLDSLKEVGVNVVGVISLSNRMEKRDDGLSVKEAIEKRGFKFYSMSSALDILPFVKDKLNPKDEVVSAVEGEFKMYGVEPLNLNTNRENITDKLFSKMDEKKTPLCIGLDPNLKMFPKPLLDEVTREFGSTIQAAAEAIRRFNFAIIDATHDLVLVFKPQSAYYEQYGSYGIKALEDTVKYAKSKEAIVILDAKRNDIGSTSTAYAEAHLGKLLLPDGKTTRSADDFDFMTINPYLGSDGVLPFIEVADRDSKGVFVLAKTSNPGSGELQDIKTLFGREFYAEIAELINNWGKNNIGEKGYSNVGAVVGATYPEEATKLRRLMPNVLFLMPGYGKQGGKAEILVNGFDNNGRGAVVNSSRAINYAFSDEKFAEKYPHLAKPEKFAEAARQATIDAIEDINSALRSAGKFPKGW